MAEEQPRKVPRVFSCLVKGPLGCLAFLVGALVVLVLFLPPAIGRFTDRFMERWFGEHHAGALELADVWLGSFYGRQRIESVILRDPQGDEVLRGALHAPALTRFQGDPPRYGPIELVLHRVRLVEHGDGTTNLGRALAPRDGASQGGDPWGELRIDGTTLDLLVVIERLSLVSAQGRESLLENLVFHGKATLGRSERDVELEGGSDPATTEPLRLSFDGEQSGQGRPWKTSWEVERAPAALVALLCKIGVELGGLLGPRVDRLKLERDGEELELELEDEGASLKLKADLVEEGRVLQAEPDQAARLSFPGDSSWARSFLPRLVPLAAGLVAADPVRVRVQELRWVRGGGVAGISGLVELELELLGYRVDPSFGSRLAGEQEFRPVPGALQWSLRVRDGVAELGGQRLPLENGWIEVGGTVELASGEIDLGVRAERDGLVEELGRFAGKGGELVEAPPVPPAAPQEPGVDGEGSGG